MVSIKLVSSLSARANVDDLDFLEVKEKAVGACEQGNYAVRVSLGDIISQER